MEAIRNTTEKEAAVLLKLAKAGVHPTEMRDKMRAELYMVDFKDLTMNQQSQAYGDYREETGDTYCSYTNFCHASAYLVKWDRETGRPWMGRYLHRNDWNIQ